MDSQIPSNCVWDVKMPTPMDEEWYPHYLDEPSDYSMLILTVVGGPASLVYTGYDTSRRLYTGEYGSKDTEASAFRLGSLAGLTGTAWTYNRLVTGSWGPMPQAARGVGAWMAHGAPIARGVKSAGGVALMFTAATLFMHTFMRPGSNYYVSPNATVLGRGPDSVMGTIQFALARTLVDLWLTAV